ncbi:type I restriction enzyme HsdR N-terminal domain-containing protein [Candidatus Pacearchaeota archaeon]|nr:type I restriction enzyme HsdR N-terminal domain-containing protein [Candidatus Pacearchaeota archaeon]
MRSNDYLTIKYPERISEFEIQSLTYGILRKEGFIVRGEVKAYKSRLDIVVYDEQKKAVCIIEVKSRKRIRTRTKKYKQVQKYEELFNLPVLVCVSKSQIQDTLNQVRRIMNGSSNND